MFGRRLPDHVCEGGDCLHRSEYVLLIMLMLSSLLAFGLRSLMVRLWLDHEA